MTPMPTAVDPLSVAAPPNRPVRPAPQQDSQQSDGFEQALKEARKSKAPSQAAKPKQATRRSKTQSATPKQTKRDEPTEATEPKPEGETKAPPNAIPEDDDLPVESETNVEATVEAKKSEPTEIPSENPAPYSQAAITTEAAATLPQGNTTEKAEPTTSVRTQTDGVTASQSDTLPGGVQSDVPVDSAASNATADPTTDVGGKLPTPSESHDAGKNAANKPIVKPLAGAESQPADKPSGTENNESPKHLASATNQMEAEAAADVSSAQIDASDPSHTSDKPSHDLGSCAPTPALETNGTTTAQPGTVVKSAAPSPQPAPPPEISFAEVNHERIVTGVRAQLLPQGGAMQIRLDPPELGALQVMVEMRDGAMQATFQTSNDEATRLLSHSLNQLKHVLESQGVSVEKLQVQQAAKNEHSNAGEDQEQQQQAWSDEHAARQEQQRKELLRRMWRKISGNQDPLDLVA
jgi:flagellar hook-length control protein FliK